ncbi:MAG TPA: SUMF1/EgtB/PvdO family nonheme iron enzyme [Dokdonella sp.]|uniref:protein kinase domain-containing protein n=1 Tax=Dokdonella sp. TaxID=2291710 RepID=UPI002CD1735A|nr:SUMF1/EgtB/PvdO family nonheme iron enzyme [Dokdonella sp.]HUD41663.1 SUMF1/EgtB/PvdO family nonheme iron enzyme [Dokdonella sp.]
MPSDPAPRRAPIPRISGYRIVSQLGRGGMAVVYLAVQESLDRQVAIKIMRPSSTLDEAQAVRFENEARVIAKLEHPGIVGIHEVGRTLDGDLYYVMPYLASGDLGQRDYRNDEDGLIALLRVLLGALDYAHARGIVHRDVKAENVLFDNADRPQLADFGIALSRRSGEPRVTSDGFALGSSAHMSPEQARGGPVDGRADLYSLGVLTYELLTGELPFRCADALGLALMHAQDPVPRLPADKAHWQGFVDRALAKRPEQRHRNAQAMLRALERVERRLHPQPFRYVWRGGAAWRRPLLLIAFGAALIVVPGLVFAPLLAPPAIEATAVPTPSAPPDADAIGAAAGAATVVAGVDAYEAALERARRQLAAGQLLLPAGANAAQTYLDLLTADPENSEAKAGLETVLAALSVPLAERARSGDLDGARERYRQAVLLADQARLREAPAFRALQLQARQAMLSRAESEVRAYERAGALAWLELAREAGADGERWDALQRRAAALLQAGAIARDRGGPALAFVPRRAGASVLPAPLLMMREEVSRADYARFADATGRKATRCRSRLSPLRLLDRRDWRDPGFVQGEAEPAVCLSADDADAYARWLSAQTGKTYRLPTRAEWRHAWQAAPPPPCAGAACATRRGTAPAGSRAASALGLNDLAGNAAEWTADCAGVDATSAVCERRIVAGTSWRDAPGDAEPPLRELAPDRGYDDVGFRLVRDLQ